MRIVLDTNVIVSGLISPFGNPAEIVRLVSSGKLCLCFDSRIITEYGEVLRRPKFQFDEEKVMALLDQIEHRGITVAPNPISKSLPDPDDNAFLEVSIGGNAICLVTGNVQHFPAKLCHEMRVLTPAQFIKFYRKEK